MKVLARLLVVLVSAVLVQSDEHNHIVSRQQVGEQGWDVAAGCVGTFILLFFLFDYTIVCFSMVITRRWCCG